MPSTQLVELALLIGCITGRVEVANRYGKGATVAPQEKVTALYVS